MGSEFFDFTRVKLDGDENGKSSHGILLASVG